MDQSLTEYEFKKEAIRAKNARAVRTLRTEESDADFDDPLERPRQVGVGDVLSLGTKIVIGGGVGLLAGIAAIAVTASAGEIILAGVVTKIAGVLGSAVGLSMGMGDLKNKKWF